MTGVAWVMEANRRDARALRTLDAVRARLAGDEVEVSRILAAPLDAWLARVCRGESP